MKDTEIWKDIEGYEGYYQVSNTGRVKALERTIKRGDISFTKKEKEKTQLLNPDGYYTVKLSKDGNNVRIAVHRLVAMAFIPNDDPTLEVNHKDFNRINNNVENLEWVTHAENVRYSSLAGRHVSLKGKDNPNYGNHKLAEYFAEHPEEKMRQSRPGAQNGRCVSVKVTFPSGETKNFNYLREAAKYIIEFGNTRIKTLDGLANKIAYCIKTKEMYYGMSFEKIEA